MTIVRVKHDLERVFAFLGLVWVIDILLARIFPRTWMNVDVYILNASWHLQHLGNKDSQAWLLEIVVLPLVLLAVLIVSAIGFGRIVQLGVKYVRHLRRPSDSGFKVSHFPSMITFVVALSAFVWVYSHTNRTMSSYWNISAGEIVQEHDLQYAYSIGADRDDLATDNRAVIGHKALKDIPRGMAIHKSDIQ